MTATIEYIVSNRGDRSGYHDGGQALAIPESSRIDSFEGVRQANRGQVRTIVECIVSYLGDGIGNVNGRQVKAIIECIVSNRGDRSGYHDGGQAMAAFESRISYTCDRIGQVNR